MGEAEPFEPVVAAVELSDDLPCVVAASVVDEHHEAVGRNHLFSEHGVEQTAQSQCRRRQHLLLVVARNNQSYHWPRAVYDSSGCIVCVCGVGHQ